MVCYDSNRHQKSMEGILEVGPRGQCPLGGLSHNPATGFTLPRQQWSLLNRFRTGQGHCGACRSKKYEYVVVCCVLQTLIYAPVWWDPNDVPQRRILIHSFIHSFIKTAKTVDKLQLRTIFCPLTKLNGGLSQLHSAAAAAIAWLTNYGS